MLNPIDPGYSATYYLFPSIYLLTDYYYIHSFGAETLDLLEALRVSNVTKAMPSGLSILHAYIRLLRLLLVRVVVLGSPLI